MSNFDFDREIEEGLARVGKKLAHQRYTRLLIGSLMVMFIAFVVIYRFSSTSNRLWPFSTSTSTIIVTKKSTPSTTVVASTFTPVPSSTPSLTITPTITHTPQPNKLWDIRIVSVDSDTIFVEVKYQINNSMNLENVTIKARPEKLENCKRDYYHYNDWAGPGYFRENLTTVKPNSYTGEILVKDSLSFSLPTGYRSCIVSKIVIEISTLFPEYQSYSEVFAVPSITLRLRQ